VFTDNSVNEVTIVEKDGKIKDTDDTGKNLNKQARWLIFN